jgi:uncharacterized protein (UPF0332 family)
MGLVDGLMEKAERAFISAEQTLDLGHADFAVSRAYYGIFYVASALLEARGIRFRKHSAVIGQFGLYIARPRVLNPAYHRLLIDAERMRINADYRIEPLPEEDVVREFIADGRAFLDAGRAYLASR